MVISVSKFRLNNWKETSKVLRVSISMFVGSSLVFVFLESKKYCGGFTVAGCQMPIQLFSHSLSLTGQGEKMARKSLWFRIKTGVYIPITVISRTSLTWRLLLYCQLKIE